MSTSNDPRERSHDDAPLTLRLSDVSSDDRRSVGGKAASLGEMIQGLSQAGIRVPGGFVTTNHAFQLYLDSPLGRDVHLLFEPLPEPDRQPLRAAVSGAPDLRSAIRRVLTVAHGEEASLQPDPEIPVSSRTAAARELVLATPLPPEIQAALAAGHRDLEERYGTGTDCAVRSSTTVEDSEMASFAGQYESYLNVRGLDIVKLAWQHCVASAFTERAVGYQLARDMDPLVGEVCVIVMKMVRSDLATSGVIFTMDPDSGNRNVIHLTSSYGLGEMVVQGSVTPDTFLLWKEGIRQGTPAVVHQELGAKDRKLIYASQGGTRTESVDVEASARRQWSLTREEAMELGRMALTIEEHYGRPMDIEWAKDGVTGELFIVQSRPETVHAPESGKGVIRNHRMDPELVKRLEEDGRLLLTGLAVGTGIGAGKVRVYRDYADVIRRKSDLRDRLAAGEDLDHIPADERVFDPGDVLVTEMTTPDWEPLMRDASFIVTERGGRTSHAAIVAREFGIPAIVGAGGAASRLQPLEEVTGTCAEGDEGKVFQGIHPWRVEEIPLTDDSPLKTAIKLNVGFPGKSLKDALLPCDGVGLARIEFILTAQVGIHPLALRHFHPLARYAHTGDVSPVLEPFLEQLQAEDPEELKSLLRAIERRTPGYAEPGDFFVDRLRSGIALICAAFHPRPVLVRLSDLKSNEYRDLLGGRLFEPWEENPMIGWRGAARYLDPRFTPAFDMELRALRAVRDELGLDNLQIMVPFCRSPEEGSNVVEHLEAAGLGPDSGVPLFLMVEIPSNVLEGEEFIRTMKLAGASIGSNDLVQTVYAVSRDDLEGYTPSVDARSPSVRRLIRHAVKVFSAQGVEVGICGQAPSDHPDEIPPFLVEAGIDSISVTPDTFYRVREAVRKAEKRILREQEAPAPVP